MADSSQAIRRRLRVDARADSVRLGHQLDGAGFGRRAEPNRLGLSLRRVDRALPVAFRLVD